MKPILPHDPLDDLIAAALHGELTPEERTAFEFRLQNDPAARAAYEETQLMHDLLEKTNREAQPDPAFEQRMVYGVRRKMRDGVEPGESAWESALVLWRAVNRVLTNRWVLGGALGLFLVFVGIDNVSRLRSGDVEYRKFGFIPNKDVAPKGETDDLLKAEAQKEEYPRLRDGTREALAPQEAYSDNQMKTESAEITNAPKAIEKSVKAIGAMVATTPTSSSMAAPDNSAVDAARPIQNAPMGPTATPASPPVLDTPLPPVVTTRNGLTWDRLRMTKGQAAEPLAPNAAAAPSVSRMLIRNASLDLEVKEYQPAVDQITALTKSAGGYVDTSNSQRGGNGKLQGTVVVKVLPQNLDGFLLKLRDLGEIKNQSVSTDDVTKDYYDTQARLDNSRRMETQLQDLLKRTNGKVAELLEVERELGRVRGEIEQMQGQLKLYDFQVQYATVTLSVQEKDLNQAAAYLLQERDDFMLFATDVEAIFQRTRRASDDFKGQILAANLNHNSGSDVSATLTVSIPPEQIDAFLDRIRSLGRVANFTRQTNRVARDGGDTNQPADQTRTEKDRVLVSLSIHSDNESRKQVAMTVVTREVDDAFDKAKAATLASPGAEIVSSSLNKTPQGQSSAQISVRVPGKNFTALLATFRTLGRTASYSLQRDDNSGPNSAGDDAPVILTLSLTDDETPLQETEVWVRATDVDGKAQQLKKDAATAGIEVKASSFERQPSGQETARMTFRLPLGKYPGFLETLKNLGKVEALTVHREDRPDQARTDDSAPAEINLELHNENPIVAEDNGLWATLRRTFGEGAAALMGSITTIGVMLAFIAPWLLLLLVVAWIARRIYVRRSRGKEVRPS